MRWWLLFVAIALLPVAIATSNTAWRYSGDSFQLDGVVYSVQAFGNDRALISAGSGSHTLALGDCYQTQFEKYCFLNSAYPDDDGHIKYVGGKELFGMEISIDTITPEVDITTTLPVDDPAVGNTVDIAVKITNEADYALENVTYELQLPANVAVAFGNTAGPGLIRETTKAMGPGTSKFISYAVRPSDYGSVTLRPLVTYQYGGRWYNATADTISFSVTTPLTLSTVVNGSLDLGQTSMYSVKLENDEPKKRMNVHLLLNMPDGLTVASSAPFKRGSTGFEADVELEDVDAKATLNLTFTAAQAGEHVILLNVTGTQDGAQFSFGRKDTVSVTGSQMVPEIKVSRTQLRAGDTVTVSGILENMNSKTTYKKIRGKLSIPGLIDSVSFDHDDFPPRKTITELEKQVVLPSANGSQGFTITFGGEYQTPDGHVYTYTTSKAITVLPNQEFVSLTHGIEPSKPKPGTNVTVTVRAKNLWGKYLPFTAKDAFDSRLRRSSGLTFAEGSLEKEQDQQVYLYQLEIPADFNGTSFNITTDVAVKNEGQQRFVITVPVDNVPVVETVTAPVVENTTAPQEAVVDTTTTSEKQPNILARAWRFLKGLFS